VDAALRVQELDELPGQDRAVWQESLREKITMTQFHQQAARFLRRQG